MVDQCGLRSMDALPVKWSTLRVGPEGRTLTISRFVADAGKLTQISVPNGVTSSLTYDTANRLTGMIHAKGGTSLEAIGYQVDPAGNRTQMTDSGGTTTWGYDALDRLTSVAYPNNDAVSYTFDPVGNRTSLTVNGTTTTSAFDAADQLMTSGDTTYVYDPLSRLTGIARPTTAANTHNSDGLRVGMTGTVIATTYLSDLTRVHAGPRPQGRMEIIGPRSRPLRIEYPLGGCIIAPS